MLQALVDLVVIAALLSAVVVGVRRGLIASLGALVGLVVGGIAAWWLMPVIGPLIPWPETRGPLTVAAALLLVAGGVSAGAGVGSALRRRTDRLHLKPLDRVLGGILSVVVTALAVSLLGQAVAVAGVPGLSAAVASSRVLGAIQTATPRPVAAGLAQLRQSVLTDGLPQFGQLLELGPDTATAPPVDLDDPALSASAQSVARITGSASACGQTVTGTGFVVAPDRVITNAHVVAGVASPVVELPGRAAEDGRIVYFDPVDDVAVISVAVHDAAPLGLHEVLTAGASGVVDGYPFGGPFTTGPALVRSVGSANVPDIYDGRRVAREIYALQAEVQPGNSGGPLLTPEGTVAGMVFAKADDGSGLAYAMTTTELMPVVAQAPLLTAPVDTGSCLG